MSGLEPEHVCCKKVSKLKTLHFQPGFPGVLGAAEEPRAPARASGWDSRLLNSSKGASVTFPPMSPWADDIFS